MKTKELKIQIPEGMEIDKIIVHLNVLDLNLLKLNLLKLKRLGRI